MTHGATPPTRHSPAGARRCAAASGVLRRRVQARAGKFLLGVAHLRVALVVLHKRDGHPGVPVAGARHPRQHLRRRGTPREQAAAVGAGSPPPRARLFCAADCQLPHVECGRPHAERTHLQTRAAHPGKETAHVATSRAQAWPLPMLPGPAHLPGVCRHLLLGHLAGQRPQEPHAVQRPGQLRCV